MNTIKKFKKVHFLICFICTSILVILSSYLIIISLHNVISLILSIIIFLASISFLIPLIVVYKMYLNESIFNRTIKKYLTIYDDVIVESTVIPDFKKKEIIEVVSLEELIDAIKELHRPIIYVPIEYDKESWFLIVTSTQIWRYIMKNNQNNN